MNHSQADTVLTELHYLPNVAFFVQVQAFQKIVLEVNENYVKQSYRNRAYILTANKIQALSIPVSRENKGKTKLKDVRINYSERWQNLHWRSLYSAYGKSPFFDFFADCFHDILYSKYAFLLDLNLSLLSKCLELLSWHDKQIILTDKYTEAPENQWVDKRGQIDLKSAPPGDNSGSYQEYQQVFGKNFAPNLSVIDLLFCEGANANMIIRQSSPRHR